MLEDIDIGEVRFEEIPFNIAGIEIIVAEIEPWGSGFIGPGTQFPDRAGAAGKVGRSDFIIAGAEIEGVGTGGIDVAIEKEVEAVPPVEMIFRKIGDAFPAGRRPVAIDKEVTFYCRNRAVRPAQRESAPSGCAGFTFYRCDIVVTIDIAKVKTGRRFGQGDGRQKQSRHQRDGDKDFLFQGGLPLI